MSESAVRAEIPPMHPSIFRLRLQDILMLCVLGLLFLGVLMVQSAAMRVSGDLHWHWNKDGLKHVIYASIALLTFFLVGRMDYRSLGKWRGLRSPVAWFLLIALIACVVVLLPHVGKKVGGARRWLPLGFSQVQVQPSELGKWSVVVFLAWWLAARRVKIERLHGLLLAMLPVGVISVLIVKEDFGTAVLIGLCAFAVCLAGGARLWTLALMIPPAAIGALAAIMQKGKGYRVDRLKAFLDPFASPQREGYHMIQSLLSFATGGIYGTGLGRGIQKLGYLPEDTTDFIFAVICEELGLAGALLTIGLYLGIIFVAWQAIRQAKDGFGQLLAFGIGAMNGFQALINIAVATVSVPPKGMSLPLVSAGGSGLVITCAALGLLYSVCREAEREEAVADCQSPVAGAEAPVLAVGN